MEREFDGVKINVEFEEAKNRQQIASGDSLNILFGKIKKWFIDLKPIAFSGKYSDLVDIPSYPPKQSGIYKITVDETGHISSAVPVTKQDIIDADIFPEYDFAVDDDGELTYSVKSD